MHYVIAALSSIELAPGVVAAQLEVDDEHEHPFDRTVPEFSYFVHCPSPNLWLQVGMVPSMDNDAHQLPAKLLFALTIREQVKVA